jgi:hypothetical protein
MSAIPSILLAQTGTALIHCTVWLGFLFGCFLKAVKKSVQNLTGLWCPWKFGIIKSFNFLNCSRFIILFQVVIRYGIILAPSIVNAGPLWQAEKWIYPGNRVSEFRSASLVPYSEVVLVNRSSLHRNEYEERVFGVSLALVEKENQPDKTGNDRPSDHKHSFLNRIAHILGFLLVAILCVVGFALPFHFDWFFIKLFDGDYFYRRPKPNGGGQWRAAAGVQMQTDAQSARPLH